MKKKLEKRKLEIQWDTEKKAEKDLEREQERAKLLIGSMYDSFKVELCSKSRKHSEITQALHKFKEDVMKQAEYLKENKLENFSQMTVDIIEAKISQLIAARITGGNRLVQHVPAEEVQRGAIAKSAPFKTKEELLEVDFVQHFSTQPGFTGFAWKRVETRQKIEFFLMAMYATGDSWLVGTMPSDYGLDDIAEYEDKEVA